MERTLISWSLPNWITILIMAAAGYAVLGLASQVLQRQQSSPGGFGLGLGG
jgi:hypothetical protein